MGWLGSVPWAKIGVGVGGSLLGGWLGNRAQQSAMQRSPEELAALRGATGAAGTLTAQGKGLTAAGMPAVTGAANYWQTLLGGNRAAMAQATAAPRGAITEQYRGAERGLERSGLRGATRDLAMADLSRERAGKIAGLTTGVQPMAAEQLGGLGTTLTGQGTAALYGTGNIWSSLLREAAANRQFAYGVGQDTSSKYGGLFADILNGMGGGKGTPGIGGAGTTTTPAFDPITGTYSSDVEPVSSGGGHWYDWFTKIFRGGGRGQDTSGRDYSDWARYFSGLAGSGVTGGEAGGGGPYGVFRHPK